jgi:hypothetical protein
VDPLHKVKHGDFAAQISNEQINLEVGSTDNCILKNIRVTVGPNQPSAEWVPVASSQEVKWPGCEVDDRLLSTAEDKNEYSYTSTHNMCLHSPERGNFTLFLPLIIFVMASVFLPVTLGRAYNLLFS